MRGSSSTHICTSQISESLKYFGISAATTSLVLIHFSPLDSDAQDGGAVNEETVYGRMKAVVEGELASLELLGTPAAGVNLKALRKVRLQARQRGREVD